MTFAVHAMTVSYARTRATRAPDNELYDRGGDLVEAAMATPKPPTRGSDGAPLRDEARLIVAGWRGRGAFSGALFGSVPMLVVPPNARPGEFAAADFAPIPPRSDAADLAVLRSVMESRRQRCPW